MKKKCLMLLVCLTLFGTFLFGYSYGSTNFSYGGYPSFDKRKPMKPFGKDSYSATNYKSEVEKYVDDAKNYVEATNNDIDEIKDAASEAINNANRIVEEYNNWVRYGW